MEHRKDAIQIFRGVANMLQVGWYDSIPFDEQIRQRCPKKIMSSVSKILAPSYAKKPERANECTSAQGRNQPPNNRLIPIVVPYCKINVKKVQCRETGEGELFRSVLKGLEKAMDWGVAKRDRFKVSKVAEGRNQTPTFTFHHQICQRMEAEVLFEGSETFLRSGPWVEERDGELGRVRVLDRGATEKALHDEGP